MVYSRPLVTNPVSSTWAPGEYSCVVICSRIHDSRPGHLEHGDETLAFSLSQSRQTDLRGNLIVLEVG